MGKNPIDQLKVPTVVKEALKDIDRTVREHWREQVKALKQQSRADALEIKRLRRELELAYINLKRLENKLELMQ